jgi:ribonucleoside-diphosphate reductase subunit M2
MESPVKKLNLVASEDKDNRPFDADATFEADFEDGYPLKLNASNSTKIPSEPTKSMKKAEKPAVAPTIKPDEVDEPLLQENPNRFVLFPIKYHVVCNCVCFLTLA